MPLEVADNGGALLNASHKAPGSQSLEAHETAVLMEVARKDVVDSLGLQKRLAGLSCLYSAAEIAPASLVRFLCAQRSEDVGAVSAACQSLTGVPAARPA